MLGFLLHLHSAIAAPPYLAVPVTGVEGLSSPHFQSAGSGWTALVNGGFVAVYTAKSKDDAQQWVESKVEAMETYAPKQNPKFRESTGADEAWGDGVGLLIFQTENFAAMCRHTTNAEQWARVIHRSVVSVEDPWPAPPKLQASGAVWTAVDDPNRVHLKFVGGRTKTSSDLVFIEVPEKVIGWDRWGRASVAMSQNSATLP